jgi:hypothetical protein
VTLRLCADLVRVLIWDRRSRQSGAHIYTKLLLLVACSRGCMQWKEAGDRRREKQREATTGCCRARRGRGAAGPVHTKDPRTTHHPVFFFLFYAARSIKPKPNFIFVAFFLNTTGGRHSFGINARTARRGRVGRMVKSFVEEINRGTHGYHCAELVCITWTGTHERDTFCSGATSLVFAYSVLLVTVRVKLCTVMIQRYILYLFLFTYQRLV